MEFQCIESEKKLDQKIKKNYQQIAGNKPYESTPVLDTNSISLDEIKNPYLRFLDHILLHFNVLLASLTYNIHLSLYIFSSAFLSSPTACGAASFLVTELLFLH